MNIMKAIRANYFYNNPDGTLDDFKQSINSMSNIELINLIDRVIKEDSRVQYLDGLKEDLARYCRDSIAEIEGEK